MARPAFLVPPARRPNDRRWVQVAVVAAIAVAAGWAVPPGGWAAVVAGLAALAGVVLARSLERDCRRAAVDAARRAVVDGCPVPCIVYDTEFRVVEWNPAAEQTFGFTRAEMLGEYPYDRLVSDEDRSAVRRSDTKLRASGETVAATTRNRTRDGREIVCEWFAGPLPDPAGGALGFVAVGVDVTARDAARDELERSRGLLVEMGRTARIGGWELDVRTGLSRQSEEFRRIFELPQSAVLDDESGLSHFPEPGRTTLRAAFERVTKVGEPYALELPFDTARGRRLWVRVSARADRGPDGRPVRVYGAVQDVTPIHDAQQSALASERRYRALVEKSTDGIALLDADARIRYVSPGVARLVGFTPDDQVGAVAFDFCHPDDVPDLRTHFARMLDGPDDPVRVRFRGRHKDGGFRVLDGVGSNRIGDPAVGAIVFNFRDVTEQFQLEEQVRQSQKMEAVGRLAGGVAHDFNNLLTVILGCGQSALDALPDEHPAREPVEQMLHAGRRAADLTRQLLVFGRKEVIARVLDVADVIRGMDRMLRRVVGPDIEVVFDAAAEPCRTWADPGQIEQVIMNLAVNAQDAMPTGGRFSITVAPIPTAGLPPDAPVEVVGTEFVAVTVSDTGHGMDAATLARAFEPFFTTKGPDRGTGLGLSTVYSIARRAGGFVTAESAVGRGTTMRVFLPRSHEPLAVTPPPTPGGAVPTGVGTVLLVEDEDTVRSLARAVLEQHGYDVLEAASGAEALELAADPATAIRIVVTDVVMPGMSGRDLAAEITRLRPGVRVLFVSGYPRDHFGVSGVVDEETSFLPKPFLPIDLARKVSEVLASTPSDS